ncbi:MAG: hypothetical protein KJ941_05595, partial [Bacteroidetes bacterium]|nr:hypothetical protein [Bacteroidota bacterium]
MKIIYSLCLLCFLQLSTNVYSQDAACVGVVTPTDGCDLNQPYSVTISIRNNGLASASLPVSCSYQLNGGPVITESTTLAVGANATVNYTFVAQVTTGTVIGANTIVCSARTTPTDINPGNNSLNKNFTRSSPTIGGSVGSSTSVCGSVNSGTLTLTGHIGGITNWEQSTNFGASWSVISNTTVNQSYTNLSTTTLFRAVLKNGFCPSVNSAPATITVKQIPPTPSVSSNSPLCLNEKLYLTASNESGANYSWTGPNGFVSALQNPERDSVKLADAGTYQVTNTFNGCTSLPGILNVVVNDLPAGVSPTSNSPVCEQGSLNLSSTTIAGAIYSWSGPNGFVSSAQNPVISGVSLNATGTYSVFVTRNGCVGPTQTTDVIVNKKPETPVLTNDSPVCVDQPINFFATSDAGATYSWIGPNGFSSLLKNPIIDSAKLASAGSYAATATLNGCTSSTGYTIVSVKARPSRPTGTSNSPVCEGEVINLTTSTVSGGVYNWTGPNSFTSSSQSPTISNASSLKVGTYTVNVTVNGCTSLNGSVDVVLVPKPATPIITTNSPVCSGNNIVLSTPVVAGATYVWSGPNGFSPSPGADTETITNAQTINGGSYGLSITVSGCTSNQGLANVDVVQTPITPSIASNSPVCENQKLNLTTPLVSGASYAWSGPNGFVATGSSPFRDSVKPAEAGIYQVIVTFNGCSSLPGTHDVVVNALPPGVNPLSNTAVCEQGTLNLSSDFVTDASYSWTGPNGFSSTQQSPVVTNVSLGATGDYTVYVTRKGCIGPAMTTSVVIKPKPAIPFLTSNTPVCETQPINFMATSDVGSTFTWSGPNGFSSSLQNPVIDSAKLASAGSYSAIATLNGCSSSAGFTIVNVRPTPARPVPTSNSPVCEGEVINLTTSTVSGGVYNWTGPNSFTSSSQS